MMDELINLKYQEEVEKLKEDSNFEALGDAKYTYHEDMEARLYWAFCRPSGSSDAQILDPHPLVSIMAFNHSRLEALKRFQLLHKDVIVKDELRTKIRNRTRMLFRDLVDNDFRELNLVLKIVPVFLDVAIDQLIYGRKWNEIVADDIEASLFLDRVGEKANKLFYEAFFAKLTNFEEFEIGELKEFLIEKLAHKEHLHSEILAHYKMQGELWLENSNSHILQKKVIEGLINKL